jgi:modification methylase
MYKNGRTNTFPQNLGLYQLVIQQYSYGMVEKGTKQAKIMNFPDNFLDKIVCGDCLSVMKQMPDECIDLVVTSPPYNLKNSTGNGLKDGRCGKWKNAALINGYSHHNDNMPHEEYAKWQRECLTEMYRLIKPDGAIFYNHKWRVQDGLLQDRQDIVLGFPIRQIIIWRRKGGINFNPGYFLPTYEVIYLITKPNFQLMPKANAHGDVWEFTQEMNNPHPAPFPVKLINRIISSTFANIVLDPFMGSGTTAISALSNNRRYIGIEISPEYIELAETRINEYHQGVLQFEEKGVYFEPVRIVESV